MDLSHIEHIGIAVKSACILCWILLLSVGSLSAQDVFCGVLTTSVRSEMRILSVMTDTEYVDLKDEEGNYIEWKEENLLSGYPILPDSIYRFTQTRTQKGYQYTFTQLHAGAVYTTLQGHFTTRDMGAGAGNVPLPGVVPCFETISGEKYDLLDLDGTRKNEEFLWGGIFVPFEFSGKLVTLLGIIDTQAKPLPTLLPYKMVDSSFDSTTIVEEKNGCVLKIDENSCLIEANQPIGAVHIFGHNGRLLKATNYRTPTNNAYIQDLPIGTPLLIVALLSNGNSLLAQKILL